MLLPAEENKRYRIALLGIYHESNTFVGTPTTLGHFKRSRWLKGGDIISEYEDAHHELGGAIEVFRENEVELVPVFYAETTPGGVIQDKAYQVLSDELLGGITDVLPVDACFVVPHGAGVAEYDPDMDGVWLSLLRDKVGYDTPIVGTLDPHANVSELMISSTNALFPYSTNPHIDQRETGRKAARFLLDILNKKVTPLQALIRAPFAISIDKQHTEAEPCKSLYAFVAELEKIEGIYSMNICLGFPYADVKDMGTSVIMIHDNYQSSDKAELLLMEYFRQHLHDFDCDRKDARIQLEQINRLPKPVLILDMGDNVGAGSDGTSTWVLDCLENTGFKSVVCIYDPQAVKASLEHKLKKKFHLTFGQNPETGKPGQSQVTLEYISNGRFVEEQPRHGGQKNYDMGKTVIVITDKGNTILLHSKRVPPFSAAQLTSCGIRPDNFDVIVAKGVNAPIAAYQPVCNSILHVNTPGQTQADMTLFDYRNRRKPLFPFETE